jgi:hypothetical protein
LQPADGNVLIGGTTDISGTGGLKVFGTTASTSTTTGSLVNAGGFGNAGAGYFGGGLITQTGGFRSAGSLSLGATYNLLGAGFQIDYTAPVTTQFFGDGTGYSMVWATRASSTTTPRMTLTDAGNLTVHGTTASTSTTTGSLINSGGFGNAGAAFFGQQVTAARPFMSTNAITANMTSAGGIGFAGGGANIYSFGANSSTTGGFSVQLVSSDASVNITPFTLAAGTGAATFTNSVRSTSATGGIGYATGAGGAVTQGTSRTTGVTLNNVCGAITLFTAAGSATWQSFTVTNSAVAATDTIIVNQRSGTDLYMMHVTAVGAGSFRISFATTGGTTSEAPVFNFSVIKAVSS